MFIKPPRSAGIAAALLVPCACAAQALASTPATPSPAQIHPGLGALVELIASLAWPVAVLLLAQWFRKPIGDFVSAVGGRVSKLSIMSLQFELAAARPSAATPLLDDIRVATGAAPLSDSSRVMLDQAQSTQPADFSLIDLGAGENWLTSRLFIAAVMMERMRGVKVFVFVERAVDTDRRFVAVVDVRYLRWALARRFPWLQAAFVGAEALNPEDPKLTTTVKTLSDTGAMEPLNARQLVQAFIDALRAPVVPAAAAPAGAAGGWVQLGNEAERASWVTKGLLVELLPESAFAANARAMTDESRARRSRAVLRCRAPFVALVDDRREFLRLVNRQAYLEEVAAALGEEPDSTAAGAR